MTKSTIAGIATVLVVAVVLTLYATGPSWKASTRVCTLGANPIANAIGVSSYCIFRGGKVYIARPTNAWERFKGAITGSP
jgi:hypothetical protein